MWRRSGDERLLELGEQRQVCHRVNTRAIWHTLLLPASKVLPQRGLSGNLDAEGELF